MKNTLVRIFLAVLAIGLLGSCSKINERLDNLEKEVSGIENEQIASINSQITGITSSIADLGTIRSDISSLKQSASDHSIDIFNLEEADRALKDRIVNLEDYVDEVLPKYAETEWVEATFSTLEQYEATCDTIAKIDARIGALDAKLSKDIKDCADSLTKWVNKTFEGYYTAAQMDAKLAQMKSAIDSAKASGGITDAKADSISAELTKTKTAVDTAKAAIRAEYKAAIKSAIETSEGKLTKALTDKITAVNTAVTNLTKRVDKIENDVKNLTGRVDALEKMIQTVTIVPTYSDGSIKVEYDTLFIDFIVSPTSVVNNLTEKNINILLNTVRTKAVELDTVPTDSIKVFTKDTKKGTVSIKALVTETLDELEDNCSLTVAVNVADGISDFTTDFVPVTFFGKVVEVGSVEAANDAFAKGETRVKITSIGDEENPILYLPQTNEEVTINFENPDKSITVKYGPIPTKATGVKPARVNIATNDITKFTVTGISNVVWLVGNQNALEDALNNATAGQTVALSNDITMTENWKSVNRGSNTPDFDGRNHVISNMTIKTQEDSYAGLFSIIENHVILQNVTFRNALIDIPASVGDNARGGILVGHMYPSDVVNCHVEGATIKAHQKIGGLIGYAEGEAANQTITIKNCSVKDVTLSSNVAGSKTVAGVGGLIGHLVLSGTDLITVENNLVENITITDSQPIIGVYNYDDYGQYLPHVFIGNACQNYKGEEAVSESKHSIVFENNRILGTNTELSTCIYSSKYFGWGGNTEDNPTWKGKIYIDGQVWTPDYPALIVETGVKYPLDKALAAATAGQTVQILKAGDYTVQTLSTKAAVVEATVEGVVFNRTAGGWVAAQTENIKTVKNITWNVGNGSYQYFSNTNLENCTVNGILFTHMANKFKNCTFVNKEGYNFWVYGNTYTEFDNCTFTCPGKNDGVAGCGSALNCYNEAAQTPIPVLIVKNCTFTAEEASNKYSAIYIKPETAFDVQITNSTCNDNFCTGAISNSKLWNLKSDRKGTTVTVNGVKVYPKP